MLWVPQKGILRVQHNLGGVGVTHPGTQATTGATSSTKGAAAQLIASTAFDAYLVEVIAHSYTAAATRTDGAMDIMIGAATEEILIPDLLFGQCGDLVPVAGFGPKHWIFPLYIPAGTRLSARAAGSVVSSPVNVGVRLYGGDGIPPFRVGRKVTTYGMDTVPNGTPITYGISGAEGSWTQITASTSEDHFAFGMSFQVGNDTTVQNRLITFDLGIGAATEELMIAEGLWWFNTTSDEVTCNPWPMFPAFHDVPAGTRLVMRGSTNAANNDAAQDCVIHAVS